MAHKEIRIRGRIGSRGRQFENIEVSARFPNMPTGRPKIELRPENRETARAIHEGYEGQFEGLRPAELGGGGGVERLHVERLYFLRSETTHWSEDIQVSRVHCDPVGVLHSFDRQPGAKHAAFDLSIWLTDNRSLGASGLNEFAFDGSAKVRQGRRISVRLDGATTIRFERQFAWHQRKTGSTIRRGYLAGTCRVEFDARVSEKMRDRFLPQLDDFLALASLASTQRTVCVGWDVSAPKYHSRYYRGDVSRPEKMQSRALDYGLIPLASIQEFIDRAWPVMAASDYRNSIKSASYAAVPMRKSSLESQYLALFAAFEELLLAFRRKQGLEFVLEESERSRLMSHLRDAVKSFNPALTSQQRSYIYDSLRATDRVPLRPAIEAFVRHFSIDLSDLWPLVGADGSLSEIRNKLVHGDLAIGRPVGPLSVATDHLRWTVERSILAILGWPLDKSEVSPRFLAKVAVSMSERDNARSEIRAHLRS